MPHVTITTVLMCIAGWPNFTEWHYSLTTDGNVKITSKWMWYGKKWVSVRVMVQVGLGLDCFWKSAVVAGNAIDPMPKHDHGVIISWSLPFAGLRLSHFHISTWYKTTNLCTSLRWCTCCHARWERSLGIRNLLCKPDTQDLGFHMYARS